ncbi:ATP-binding protein [Bifidobacterium olomucense]|uniref:P-loop containing region of AAA domain-containing protein n=1 Tax=Bifidobacterium olomucense TaxID=2675324 RepID=A0A7Y0EWY0_9BIFI|nr:ATP-binding protein [Bifidobacterium sp. DSM 109959]NMM97925.1 P-loop containing region of AAA domain-containing protein [Bifidobacterium sp. DSM 109959]
MAAAELQMIADRWMMVSRRLVNWGSYEGYHEFRPSTDSTLPVTLLAGASESGKSTLVDAQISLLYPTGTPFNKASNSGRSERSDYTYLRGMIGVGSTEHGDEPIYLRGKDKTTGAPQAVWGAIVDTYRNQTSGQILSCAKFLYLQPGDGRADVRRQYAVWGKPIDPRLMDPYRESPFTPGQLRDTYPDCLTFPSAEAFHSHIWSIMGLSEEACRLLHKIQSADTPSKLDDIFKQGVLGVPEALELARTAVEDYERYDANFHAMEEKTKRMDALHGIQDAYGEYAKANKRVRMFDIVKSNDDSTVEVPETLRDWAMSRMRAEVSMQLPIDRSEAQAYESEARNARRNAESMRGRIDMIRGQMQGLDGGNLTRLEMELNQAKRVLEESESTRKRIEQTFVSIDEQLPASEQAWTERRINAVDFKRTYDERVGGCEEQLAAAMNARAAARDTLEKLQRDYDRQKSQRTRITQHMDETRAMLARATGLTPADLPYVAELMDVKETDEQWRIAMNVAYGSIAQTILVDERHEQGFAAKVSTIDPHAMSRSTWQFVDTTRDYGNADKTDVDASDEDEWLSGKLRYREDSPFSGWLRSQTQSERYDALCVTIDDSDHSTRQVQTDGQIKSGARGQHGIKDRAQVIGFVNEAYLKSLEQQISQSQEALEQANDDYTAAKQQSDKLHRELELANQLAYTSWERIDIDGARKTIADIEASIASIKNDPKLAELAARKDELTAELEQLDERHMQAEQSATSASQAVEAALLWLNHHANTTQEQTGVETTTVPAVPNEVAAALAEAYENRFAGLEDAAMRAHMIIGAGAASSDFAERVLDGMVKDIDARIAMLKAQADAARTTVESKMSAYIGIWAADDDALTASVEDYRYYLDELESLTQLAATTATETEYHRCLEQLLMSFLTIKRAIDTDATDIHDQLDRINAMLKGQQFGPKHGSLSLQADVRRPERVFSSQLTRAIGVLNDWKSTVGESDDSARRTESRRAFAACAPMIALLKDELAQVKDANGIKQYGARNLDPRCRSSFYAIVHHADGPDERITSTGGRSGGALQELTSFVYGAALIYLLGGGMENRLKPSYTTLFLDEALIKADGRYTQRALSVLPRLGFQVIVSAPESKTGEILEVSTKAYVTYKDSATGLTSLREATWSRYVDAFDEAGDETTKGEA